MKRTERRDLIKTLLIVQITQLIKDTNPSILCQILHILYSAENVRGQLADSNLQKKILLNQSASDNSNKINDFFREVEQARRYKPFI